MENEIKEIIDTLKSADNEATDSPYWIIIDPHQMFRCDVFEVASMITGPFFSRPDAQSFLDRTKYNFSKHARVFCHSGYHSIKYKSFYRSIENKLKV